MNQPNLNHLVVISAPSGAGKTTLCQKLLEDIPELMLSISFTTREPRGNEENGVDYYFISSEEFKTRIQKNRFAEWALVHGNYYGTSKDGIDEIFRSGHSVLLDIDVQGAEQLQKAYPNQCYNIFIAPPSLQELEFRLRARATDSEETIQKRLENARVEMGESQKFNSIVVNDSLQRAYQELKHVVMTRLQFSTQENRRV